MVKLSVVIVNYNVKYFVELAISAVMAANKNIATEIFVVDNCSTDGSVAFLQQRFPSIQVIANKENVGFSAANNQAIRISSGEYVLLLNPDTVVAEDTFEKCIAFMEQHPDAGGLGVRMIDGTGAFLPESKRAFPGPAVAFYKAFGLSGLFPKSKVFGAYHLGFLDEKANHPVDVLAGAFMMMRRKVLDHTGLLDEHFFMYGEDIDLSYRIRQSGHTNYYLADAPIIHFKGESTKKGSLNYVQMFYNAMKIFAGKHFSGNNRGIFVALINLSIYLRAGIAVLTRIFNRWGVVLLDIILIFFSMLLVKEYWEYYVRYIDGGTYPPSYLYINIPLYTFLWIVSIYFSGGYDKGATVARILRGLLWGTILIAAAYGFFPDSLRFSRGMIVAGAAVSGAVLLLARLITHFIQTGNIRFGEQALKRIIIVAEESEANAVYQLLDKGGYSLHILGFAGEPGSGKHPMRHLGKATDIISLTHIYQPGELIFVAGELTYKQIIEKMDMLAGKTDFKLVVPGGSAIVGSNSKNTAGDLYLSTIYSLGHAYNLRLKRLIDVIMSLFILLTAPVQWLLVRHPLQLMKNAWAVLRGKCTWVGYASPPADILSEGLPQIPQGVLSADLLVEQRASATPDPLVLDRIYAREYQPAHDLLTIFRLYRLLGRRGNSHG